MTATSGLANSMAEDGAHAPKTMLVADDDPAIVRLVADRCAKMGFDVQTATNGIQLLIKARQSRPDVIIADVNMPGLDGLSVCLRLLAPGDKPIDVIVITGGSDQTTIERCESMGLYFAKKGPEFWNSIEAAIIRICPAMAGRIEDLDLRPSGADVHERPRVLVVDDDPDVERFLSSRLKKCGVDTIHASGAMNGYRIARREKPSVIICDYFMPNGDAHYLLTKLRTTPGTENIPVIVISISQLDAVTEQKLRQEICNWPGAAHILRKSFDTRELFGVLQTYCAFSPNFAQS